MSAGWSSAPSERHADPQAQLAALVVLAVEAPVDDVARGAGVVGPGVAQLLQESHRHPPRGRRVMQRRPEEIRRVLALGVGEAVPGVVAVVAVLEAGVPARREAPGEAGGEFDFTLFFPLAVEVLLLQRGAP